MKKFATALTVLTALSGLALMSTEASAQRVARRGPAMGAVRGGPAFRGGPGPRFVGPGPGFHRGRRGWGWGAGAAALGLGLGAAAAGAYYGAPGYYGYPPGCVVRQWTPYGWQLVRVC